MRVKTLGVLGATSCIRAVQTVFRKSLLIGLRFFCIHIEPASNFSLPKAIKLRNAILNEHAFGATTVYQLTRSNPQLLRQILDFDSFFTLRRILVAHKKITISAIAVMIVTFKYVSTVK